MDCEQLAPLYEEYALGILEGDERAELEAHLARACPTCTPGVAKARWVVAQLAHAAPDAQPPAALRGKILDAVKPSTDAVRKASPFEKPRIKRAMFPAWAWAAAAALALVTGYSIRQIGNSNHAAGGSPPSDETRDAAKPGAAESAGRRPHGRLGHDVARFHAAQAHAERQEYAHGACLLASAHGRGHHRRSDAGDCSGAHAATLGCNEKRAAHERGHFPAGFAGSDCAGGSGHYAHERNCRACCHGRTRGRQPAAHLSHRLDGASELIRIRYVDASWWNGSFHFRRRKCAFPRFSLAIGRACSNPGQLEPDA